MLVRIKKDDLVLVISGKDKGKQGQVALVDTKADKIVVKGVSLLTKHVKPRRQGEKGGIKKEEAFVDLSKVMPICPACKKPCRVQTKTLEGDGKKVRICHRCKEAF